MGGGQPALPPRDAHAIGMMCHDGACVSACVVPLGDHPAGLAFRESGGNIGEKLAFCDAHGRDQLLLPTLAPYTRGRAPTPCATPLLRCEAAPRLPAAVAEVAAAAHKLGVLCAGKGG